MTARRLSGLLAFAVPFALLSGAYISQYGFGLYPCEMCWWQRYPHIAAIAFGILAFALKPARWPIALAGLAVLVSGLIGAFHAGVEYGWWEGVTACTALPSADGDDLMEAILNAPLVRCDVAPWSLFGVSLAGWNFLISTGSALLILHLVRRSGRDLA